MAVKEIKRSISGLTREELKNEVKRLRNQIKDLNKLHLEKERRIEKEFQQKHTALYNNIQDPVFVFDAITYKFLHCNDSAIEEYGYSLQELLSMTPFDLHNPDEFEKS